MTLEKMMIAALCLSAVMAAPAAAQSDVSKSAESAQVSTSQCERPEVRQQMSVTQDELVSLAERIESYIKCMKPAIDAQRKRAETMFADAKIEAERSNAQAAEINTLIEDFNKLRQRQGKSE